MKKQNNKKKNIIYSICIIIAFSVTAVIVALASQSGGDYIVELVRAEQKDHYEKLDNHTRELAQVFVELEEYAEIADKKRLSDDEKEEVEKILRHMEEIGLNIARRNIFYAEDTTAHFFFAPNQYIVDYFEEAKNTQLYVDRCVRFVETGLTIPYPTQKQKDSVREHCGLLADEIERLEKCTQ